MTTTHRSRMIEMAQEALARAEAKRDAQTDARLRAYFQDRVDAAQHLLDAQQPRPRKIIGRAALRVDDMSRPE